jgi:hypothetical protein
VKKAKKVLLVSGFKLEPARKLPFRLGACVLPDLSGHDPVVGKIKKYDDRLCQTF